MGAYRKRPRVGKLGILIQEAGRNYKEVNRQVLAVAEYSQIRNYSEEEYLARALSTLSRIAIDNSRQQVLGSKKRRYDCRGM